VNSVSKNYPQGFSIRSLIIIFIVASSISLSFYFIGFYPQYNIPNILSAGIVTFLIIIFIQKSTNSIRDIHKTYLFILSSLLCWLTAEFLYAYYDGFLRIDAYPSFADCFYLTGYIFFILYLYLLNKSYKIELGFIISALVTFSLFVIYILYISIFIFEIYTFSNDIIGLILLFSYLVLDAFIILVAIAYYLRGRSISLNKGHNYWILIASFGFLFFIADFLFGFNDLFKIIYTTGFFDLLYNVGYIVLGICIIIKIRYAIRFGRNITFN
jgi:hypothetical protein